MDILGNASVSVASVPSTQTPAPTMEQDTRPVADTIRANADPTPEVPLPLPASTTQTGLISPATLKAADSIQKNEGMGVSDFERTLKPYGITMLPEKTDTPKNEGKDQPQNE